MAEKQYPEPTVGALIFNKKGKVFLMKSPKWGDRYIVPGGHVELKEKIADALKREIKQETNLDIYDITLVGVQDCIFDEDFVEKKHFIFIDFVCKTNYTEVKLNEEGIEYGWFSLKEVLDLPNLCEYTKNTIKKYISMCK
ncbi:MAG: NUDIX domain-containing protein [Candidatus Woesearchaeota archaeon]|nr:MAG: NUDIX domain-containing protein [Candidatus Woesearchaeota archaeon]